MEKGPHFALTIQRMPEGGYLIVDEYWAGGGMRQLYFASTTIDEALVFIRGKLLAPKVESKSGGIVG